MSSYFETLILGQHIVELPKSTLPASAIVKDGTYPFYCSSSEVKRTNVWFVNKPTVLMGTGGIASVNYGDEKFSYSTDTWGIRSCSGKLSTKYLHRIIQLNLDLIGYVAFEGSGLKHLRKNFIKNLKVQVPNNSRQLKITMLLDTIDYNIEQTQALIEKYKLIKIGMMQNLFTRGILPDGSLRLPREEAPELYKKTSFGWIPKKWNLTILNNIASFQRGHDMIADDFREGPFPVISSSGIIGYHNVATTKGPNVIVGRKGSIGKVHYIEKDLWAHDTSLYVTDFHGNIEEYVYYLCVYLELENYGTKSGSPSLNRNDIHSIELGNPSIKEQNQIISMLNAVDFKVTTEVDKLNKLKNIRTGLVNNLLLGKTRVNTSNGEASV